MDRLTTRRADGSVETTGKTYSEFHMGVVDCFRGNDRYDVRLAEYEDTGLSPEQVQDIKAELENINNIHKKIDSLDASKALGKALTELEQLRKVRDAAEELSVQMCAYCPSWKRQDMQDIKICANWCGMPEKYKLRQALSQAKSGGDAE